jgi:diguanylate cyclase (GGDEF)-like protein/PAS domain S-box-containing protein
MKIKDIFKAEDVIIDESQEQEKNIFFVRKLFVFFVVIYAIFGMVDPLYFPDHLTMIYIIRFGIVVPLFIVTIVLSFRKNFLKYNQYMFALNFFIAGMGIAYMLILNPENIIYYGGLFIVYFSGYLLIKLKFVYASIAGWSIFLFHVIGYIVSNDEYSDSFMFGLLFFAGANIIGMVGAYNIESLNRRRRLRETKISQMSDQIIRQYDERYHLLYETMTQGVVYQNSDGFITSCNPKAEEILGLSLDQMQGKTSMDTRWKMIDEQGNVVLGENHPAMIALRTKHKVGPVTRGIYRPEKNDYVWLRITAVPIQDENNEKDFQVYATFEDITEKTLADKKATYMKNLLEYIIKKSSQGIAVHDKNMNYVYVSEAYCKMYRVSQDIIGKHHYDVFPDLPEKWKEVHQRALSGEVLRSDRDEYIRSDGSVDYTRWECHPWYDENNAIAGIVIYTEVINDLIETEIQLKDSHQKLLHIMDRLPIGIAVNSVDPEVNFEYMNDNFPKFYNTTREALQENDSFWDVVYEDESFKEEIKIKVVEGIKSKEPSKMKWEDVPITQNGQIVKYISAYAIPLPNSETIISTVLDVTERKMKENMSIHTSNHDYLTKLPNRRYFEEMLNHFNQKAYYPLSIVMLDLDGLKIINDAFGHEKGNDALIKVANIINDIRCEYGFAARIGGDEFIILCPNKDESHVSEMKRLLFEKVNLIKIEDFKFSLSFGYSIKSDDSKNIDEIIKEAEDNMYSNKVLHGQTARNESVMSILHTLKDKYNEERIHSDKVSFYCKRMGEVLGLDEDHVKELEIAGLMHDIGKITIPDSILDKPDKLTSDEWKIMKTHTINGYNILRSADKYSRLAEYALTHHERWDGNGYPNGLHGENIPLFSRIISISDAFEAMTADRPYRKALSQEIAIAELIRCSGSQFDPRLVNIFINDVIQHQIEN